MSVAAERVVVKQCVMGPERVFRKLVRTNGAEELADEQRALPAWRRGFGEDQQVNNNKFCLEEASIARGRLKDKRQVAFALQQAREGWVQHTHDGLYPTAGG